MKNLCLIAFCVFGYGAAIGQSLERDVTASSGDNFNNGTASLSWTLGECVTETASSGDFVVTQGFQQGLISVSNVSGNTPNVEEVLVYPNPTSKILKVELKTSTSSYIAEFTDLSGKLVCSKPLIEAITGFDIEGLKAGNYLLNIKTADGKTNNTYKIIKY